jgi:very-short-patch-repair endonuclease
VARAAADEFHSDMKCDCVEVRLESPIEMMMWVALHTVAKVNGVQLNDVEGIDTMSGGVAFYPQYKIGKYRVDFLVASHPYGPVDSVNTREVIVECDGTAFHERTEPERRREKARDRFLQRKGYRIFRYTGAEILSRAYEIAAEIIDYVEGDAGNIVTPQEYFNV